MKKTLLFSIFSFSIICISTNAESQNVGIGTNSPAFKLDVKVGSINTDSVYRINTSTVLSINGIANLFVGNQAGPINLGVYNTFSGNASGAANTNGNFNSFFGANSGVQNIDGSNNAFFGFNAGFANKTGWYNSFFGETAGGSNTTGFNNCFFGRSAGLSNTTGSSNIAIGKDALWHNTVGSNSVAIGDSALYKQAGNTPTLPNMAIGSKAGFNTSDGYSNLFIGDSAGYWNTYGYNNSFVGKNAGGSNSTGYQNTYTGLQASPKSTIGSLNACFGTFSGFNSTTGNANTFVGYSSGYGNMTGSNLTMIGAQATPSNLNLSTSSAIGANAIVGCSNCMALGGTLSSGFQTRVGINNTTPITDLHIIQQSNANFDNGRGIRLQSPNGNQWRVFLDPSNNYVFQYNNNLFAYIDPVSANYISSSDERLKENISTLPNILDKIMLLQPKTYQYTASADAGRSSYGFIAQEVENLFPDFVYTNDSDVKGIAYSNFSVVAIKAIQEQQKLIEELLKKNKELEERIVKLEKK